MSKWFSVSHLIGIRLTGPDATAFCQSQLTADVDAWNTGQWQIAGWCNPKGRVVAIILAVANEGGVDLILPAEQLGTARKLGLYAIGRQVELSEAWAVEGALESEPGDLRLAQDTGRALRLVRSAAPERLPDLTRWRIADLCLPLPWLTTATTARYLPQALDLEHNGGLSYTKGCFPGQEVIARVHYRGRVTHRLLGFELNRTDLSGLEPGCELIQRSGARAAEVLTAIPLRETIIGLAVSPVEVESDSEVCTATENGAPMGRMTTLDRLCYYREQQEIIDPESSS